MREKQPCWQGVPAPRCFVFRNLYHALFGVAICLAALAWLWGGWQLHREGAQGGWLLLLLPLAALLPGLWLALGQLLWNRLCWQGLRYTLQGSELRQERLWPRAQQQQLQLSPETELRLRWYSEHLATLRFTSPQGDRMTLYCIEQPQLLLQHLAQRGIEPL